MRRWLLLHQGMVVLAEVLGLSTVNHERTIAFWCCSVIVFDSPNTKLERLRNDFIRRSIHTSHPIRRLAHTSLTFITILSLSFVFCSLELSIGVLSTNWSSRMHGHRWYQKMILGTRTIRMIQHVRINVRVRRSIVVMLMVLVVVHISNMHVVAHWPNCRMKREGLLMLPVEIWKT